MTSTTTPASTAAAHPARWRGSARGTWAGSVITHAVLIAGAVVMVFPFVWQVLTAFKTQAEAVAVPVQVFPSRWEWAVFTEIFDVLPFAEQLRTSAIVALVRTVGQVLLCSLAAYAFARLHFRGRELLFALFLSVLMVPGQLLILPQYELMVSFGLLNTIPALILPGLFSAFGTFLLRQFFLTIPAELEEAALIDGASRLRIYWSVMLPLVRPALAALAVITMMNSWNDLLWPLVVNTDPNVMPISAGLTTLQGQFQTNYPALMAGALLASLPMLLVFLVLQRQFVQGIALTGSKG
ncbi:carbohydrate ABC transporter permease [Phytoactinopolyspora alkaliphila]|uniref:Carbohydrate ABC transporter permease n=1 Tax=Phytoactinopolyspora alkaliphila TaxID=1783498 RepID=A0A6N9YNS8_9ACTN|nr:carbohydrate ABC transporter permease [Phytoactinopolyspora alkaliphila]NED96595.1 carbohydrate ABC transporter permease [Phytoactinopolyspora alkaliphila]